MNLPQLIDKLIEVGIEGVKEHYTGDTGRQKDKREGAIAGFRACKGLEPDELRELLDSARTATEDERKHKDGRYWWYRCYEVEVEWVCNCVSVVLKSRNLPPIVTPTFRAATLVNKLVFGSSH